ncbi:MAG TPA: phospholipid scramblase-related protein [Polyangiaceae bacterium]|jgi:uncharacterized protein YxjI
MANLPVVTAPATLSLRNRHQLFVKQRHEIAELFGYETRNKYEILDPNGALVAFAAEQQKGVVGFLFRQVLGHWRTFDIQFFTQDRQPLFRAHHPFRFFFQRLEIFGADGAYLGALQQRFSIINKRFDVQDSTGQTIMECASPIWRIWTFPFTARGHEVACVKKKWAGLLAEGFTDKDNFAVDFAAELSETERSLVLAAAIFIDLQYFERKAS